MMLPEEIIFRPSSFLHISIVPASTKLVLGISPLGEYSIATVEPLGSFSFNLFIIDSLSVYSSKMISFLRTKLESSL